MSNSKSLKSIYKTQLQAVKRLVKNQIGHCLLICPDSALLCDIVDCISEILNKSFDNIKRKINVNHTYEKTLFIINTEDPTNTSLKKQLYFLFELNEGSNFAVVFANTVDCVDNMEKRVRSRFNNEIVFFPVLPETNKKNSCLSEMPVPTIQYRNTMEFNSKYNISNLKICEIYRMLSPEHLSLLILSKKQPINQTNVYEYFQKFVLGTPELRKRQPTHIVNCYYNLKALHLIKKEFCGDWDELKDYIENISPIYINLLLHKLGK